MCVQWERGLDAHNVHEADRILKELEPKMRAARTTYKARTRAITHARTHARMHARSQSRNHAARHTRAHARAHTHTPYAQNKGALYAPHTRHTHHPHTTDGAHALAARSAYKARLHRTHRGRPPLYAARKRAPAHVGASCRRRSMGA